MYYLTLEKQPSEGNVIIMYNVLCTIYTHIHIFTHTCTLRKQVQVQIEPKFYFNNFRKMGAGRVEGGWYKRV